ncbi:MAG: SbcC/MukB-like Walker B domain-containing protein [Pirellulales bacterium]
MDHLLDTQSERPGYRLQRLEILNWGTFDSSDGQVFRFEPEGRTALLVGHNGSGKSTLVDAILTLLVDSRTRDYNVAAGAKKTERSAKSYIRGAYDRTADDAQASVVKYLRAPGAHFTAISAVFQDESLNKAFTLCQVMFLAADGSEDKVFALADESRQLKDDVAGLRKSDQVRQHLKQLGYQTTKKYVEYHGWLTRRTQMRSKAMDVFNQTVAVKDIRSLNTFIRRHMLESHDWRDKVQRLLVHFHDLSLAHQELVRARKGAELLGPVEKLGLKYQRQAADLESLEQQLAAAATFFSVQMIRLQQPQIVEQEQQLAATEATFERFHTRQKATSKKIRLLQNELDRTGGDRLKQIFELIDLEKSRLELKQTVFTHFHDQLKVCHIQGGVADAQAFEQVRTDLRTAVHAAEEKIAPLNDRYERAIGKRAEGQKRLRHEQLELKILRQRGTNLPARFSAIRSRICNDLKLQEADLPFVAELMRVDPEEGRWQGSIEMVLRPFARSLLVPARLYQRVRNYVEANRISDARGAGQRLDYLCVGKDAPQSGDRIHPQSLIRKLQFRPGHELTSWIQGEIQRRFDFRCCETVEEFHEVARFAVTVNRHVKFGNQRHQKDDRARTADSRHFVLGWDNTEKKKRVAAYIRQLQAGGENIENAVAESSRLLEELRQTHRAALGALEVADFALIDVHKHQLEIADLQQEKEQLEQSNDVIKTLRQRLSEAEKTELDISKQLGAAYEQKGLLRKQQEDARQLLANAQLQLQKAKDAGHYQQYEHLFESITQSLGRVPLSTENLFSRREKWETDARQHFDRLRQPLQALADRLVNAMARYLREFKEEQNDLDASVYSLESFLGILEQIRQEDLPRYEKRFKDRLNDQVSQEMALFNTELRQERKQIEDKIALLNKSLATLEYNPGTAMRLEPRRVQDREIDEFRRSLSECVDGTLGGSLEQTEAANEARFLRIQKLVARLGDKEKSNWRNKVIDVRNWYDFAAREIERETGQTHSYYDGSSGQSGGEKAKLAFTILVAALAYQYDIDPDADRHGRFHFVVVDEMFSKVDDQNAQYALKLFKQFGLQLLIVAPLDAKARVTEPFVDRYLQVVKDAKTHHSQLYSMTAREYEEVVQGFAGNGKPDALRRLAAK